MTPVTVILAVVFMFALVTIAGKLSEARADERIRCTGDGVDRDVTLARRLTFTWRSAEAVDVVRCDAFDDPERVTCAKSCLATATHCAGSGRPE